MHFLKGVNNEPSVKPHLPFLHTASLHAKGNKKNRPKSGTMLIERRLQLKDPDLPGSSGAEARKLVLKAEGLRARSVHQPTFLSCESPLKLSGVLNQKFVLKGGLESSAYGGWMPQWDPILSFRACTRASCLLQHQANAAVPQLRGLVCQNWKHLPKKQSLPSLQATAQSPCEGIKLTQP